MDKFIKYVDDLIEEEDFVGNGFYWEYRVSFDILDIGDLIVCICIFYIMFEIMVFVLEFWKEGLIKVFFFLRGC